MEKENKNKFPISFGYPHNPQRGQEKYRCRQKMLYTKMYPSVLVLTLLSCIKTGLVCCLEQWIDRS